MGQAIHQFINSSTGMDQEIHPCGQGRIDSDKINPSLLRMREWLMSTQISRCEESGHYITSIAQDKMWNLKKDSCKNDFSSHATLTPGLYLMTCGCSYKSIYGFSLMLSGESPKKLFDVIMTRFEEHFNPNHLWCKQQGPKNVVEIYFMILYVFTG